MKKEEIIGRGAEALLIKRQDSLIKRRIKKGYRHERLDLFLRNSRTRHEARILERASKVILVPKVKTVDGSKKFAPETEIEMEFVDGKVLSKWLGKFSLDKSLKICREIGKNTAKLHDADIIHNDLTTSNMIVRNPSLSAPNVYFIDFGLSFHSARIEDKAVDLHLLQEALKSRHFENYKEYFNAVIQGYNISKNASLVTERLKKVEARGRYKGKH